jgi:ribosomal protein L11 methyltransferase
LAVPLRKLAAPGAHTVLSGLLPSHANAALAIYRAQGFTLERRVLLEGWATLVLRRASSSFRDDALAPDFE